MNWHRQILVAGLVAVLASPALAATLEVRIAKQPGLGYLPLMVMRHDQLLEKHAKTLGLDVKSEWLTFTGGAAMNEALISGNLDIATGGIPPLLTIWSRTKNNLKIKGIAALSSQPQLLLTTNPNVKKLADFSSVDKIALPAVKVSNQAVMIQMAAIKQMGEDKVFSVDPYTVSMGHVDAMAALLGGSITAHFGQSPYQELEMKDPKVHAVLNSYDIVGAPYPIAVGYATDRFVKENPKVLEAFVAALKEAQQKIQTDPDFAAKVWIEMDVKKFSMDEAKSILSKSKMTWDAAPHGTITFLKHMNKVGLIKADADDWKDIYFAPIHDLHGS